MGCVSDESGLRRSKGSLGGAMESILLGSAGSGREGYEHVAK